MTPPERQSYDREHRRETFLYLIVPLMVAVVTVLAALVVVFLLQRQMQVSIIADWMMTVFILCPAVVCGFVMCVLLITLVILMRRAQAAVLRPVRWADEKTQQAAEHAEDVSEIITQQIIKLASKFTFLDRLLSLFDEPTDEVEKKEENDVGTSTQ